MPALHALCCGRLSFDRTVFFPDATAGERTTVPVPGVKPVGPYSSSKVAVPLPFHIRRVEVVVLEL